MLKGYIRVALTSIRSARWRSFLTMLGVMIGVLSVVTIVSLGEGVRTQVTRYVNRAGLDLITVRPGKLVDRDKNGNITRVHLIDLFGSGSFSEADVSIIKKTPGLDTTVPFARVNGVPLVDEHEDSGALLIGTTDQAPSVLGQKILYGSFFAAKESQTPVAVVGQTVADELFKENVPIGRSFTVRGHEFVVRGVFERFPTSPLTPGVDYNNAIFIPYQVGKQINNGQTPIYQVLARPKKGMSTRVAADTITKQLATTHGGQTDFSVLAANDNLAIANHVLPFLTGLVSAVAAISLIVGGIGIMNVMLVSVSERTHEIGVRKSVGATNRQVLGQFLTEAIVLSGVGGMLGVLLSLVTNYFLRLWTSFEPSISPGVMILAVSLAVGVGMIFGITPAVKASRKDPIEALRRV